MKIRLYTGVILDCDTPEKTRTWLMSGGVEVKETPTPSSIKEDKPKTQTKRKPVKKS